MEESVSETPLIIPAMGGFYDNVAQPLAYLGLRILVGGMLMSEGWPKIQAPFAMSGFTENIGMYPGWLWSAVLAVMQFGGGAMILAGSSRARGPMPNSADAALGAVSLDRCIRE